MRRQRRRDPPHTVVAPHADGAGDQGEGGGAPVTWRVPLALVPHDDLPPHPRAAPLHALTAPPRGAPLLVEGADPTIVALLVLALDEERRAAHPAPVVRLTLAKAAARAGLALFPPTLPHL